MTQNYSNGIGPTADLDPDGPGTGVAVGKPITEAQNKLVCAVAKAHGAVCVDIYHAFNGPDGLSSPAAARLPRTRPGSPSQRGQDIIAAAMANAGYAPGMFDWRAIPRDPRTVTTRTIRSRQLRLSRSPYVGILGNEDDLSDLLIGRGPTRTDSNRRRQP